MNSFRAFSTARMSSSSFSCVAFDARFALFWITNTIQNVTTVVVVLMNSCHVSEKWKIGPVSAQTTTSPTLATSACIEPRAIVIASAPALNRSRTRGSGGSFAAVGR